jgi:hypothetical protein
MTTPGEGSLWTNLLLYKMAPLCPQLARKLRQVCKTLASKIPPFSEEYRLARRAYEAPLHWYPAFIPQSWVTVMSSVDDPVSYDVVRCVDGIDNISQEQRHAIFSFIHFVIPETKTLLSPWGCTISFDHPITMQIDLTGRERLKFGARSFCNPWKCRLGCEEDECFGGLSWDWILGFDSLRQIYYFRTEEK